MSPAGGGHFDRLAKRYGIVGTYRNFDGNDVAASAETKRSLLAAMGIEARSDDDARAVLSLLEAADRSRHCRPEHIIASSRPMSLAVKGQCGWRLADEDGQEIHSGRAQGKIDLPGLESGIYRLDLDYPGGGEDVALIAAPPGAPSLRDVTGSGRLWGVTAALYGLTSSRNLGMGDYSDLSAAAEALAMNGAHFLGINPVHAIGIGDRETISPYSPTSRLFYNVALIAFDAIAELTGSGGLEPFLRDNAAKLEALRAGELVDYEALRPVHDFLFGTLFEIYCAHCDILNARRSFTRFAAERGESLKLFALYETISEVHGPDSRKWPENLQRPDAPGAVSFAAGHERRIGFHCWLQWIADRQLAEAQKRARKAGMAIGLYLDISVGSRPGGAESWAQPEAIASGVSLGAPPDAFSPQGQNWNLVPYSPEGLRRVRYKPFARMLRAAMRHAGMVRIDHALGLARSFWVSGNGELGGYVRYPLDALLAVIAIEAERSGTIVIGEDLGLVAPEFREKLQRSGLYGCAVIQFERDRDGRFNDPRTWREMSLGSFGTHDTPTFEGFRQARDVEWGMRLSRGRPENPAAVKSGRRRALGKLFASMGIGSEGGSGKAQTAIDNMHEALARSGSALVTVQLDDALGVIEQQNLPGTINEHPNWRRRYRLQVESLAGDGRLSRLGKIMSANGRGGRGKQSGKRAKRKDGP